MRRKLATHIKSWALLAALALVTPSATSLAQGITGATPPATGLPRNILPPAQMPDTVSAPSETSAPKPVLAAGRAAVQVGDLGTVEGPVAGTLDGSNGGLGRDAWQGSDRGAIVTILQSVPAATPSSAHRLLMRKVLLTAAPPPPGRAPLSFNQVRLNKLLEGGYLQDAADLALRIQEPANFDLLRTQTDALLYARRDTDACSDVTTHRLETAEPFWVELRAFCYAATGDMGALDLTRAVITEQGIADPAFVTLLDGWTNGKPVAPDTIRFPDSIHVAMLARLKLPMTSEIATGIGLSGSLIAASSAATPNNLRIAAAEKALRAGVLPASLLGEVLDLTSFAPPDLDGAPALARGEPLVTALARLRAAVKTAGGDAARAELIHSAFEIGEREGLLAQVSVLFAEQAATIMPAPEWSGWSDVMIRGLLLADRAEAAQRWFDILDRNAPGMRDTVDQLELALAFAAPNPRRNTEAKQLLADLAAAVHPSPPEPPMPAPEADASMPDQAAASIAPPEPPMPPAKPPAELVARATLDLGLFDAAGEMRSMDLQSALEPLLSEQSPGRRPAPILMQRIDKAALADSRGEVALSVAAALGPQGAGDLAPDIVVRLARALQTAGIRDAAHSLAAEALLMRPRAGAAAAK